MIRFKLVVLALAASVASVACGGSPAPAKDPSADPNAPPNANPNGPSPNEPNAAPTPGLGGTGTGSGQGQFGPGH